MKVDPKLFSKLAKNVSNPDTTKVVSKAISQSADFLKDIRKNVKISTEKKGSNAIDYIGLIDDLSDGAFNFLREKLYPVLDYQVLEEHDVRKIDMEEKIISFDKLIASKDEVGKISCFYVRRRSRPLLPMLQLGRIFWIRWRPTERGVWGWLQT